MSKWMPELKLIPKPQLVPIKRMRKTRSLSDSAIKTSDQVQTIVDRVKQLKMLPRPRSSTSNDELRQLSSRIKNELIDRPEVAKFCLVLGRRRFPTANFILTSADESSCCTLCECKSRAGSTILVAKSINENVCLSCVLDFEEIY
jgi:hypothetical protein